MNVVVSRQEAIDVIKHTWAKNLKPSQYIEMLSSQQSMIQDILEYLDTELHPIVSPEHYHIYSELHNMVSALLP